MVVPTNLREEKDYIRIKTVYLDNSAQNALLKTGRIDELIAQNSKVDITYDCEKLWVKTPKESMEAVLAKLEEVTIFQYWGCGLEINVPNDLQDSLVQKLAETQERTKTWIRLPVKGYPRRDELVCPPGFVIARIFGAPENCQLAAIELFKWMRRRKVYFKAQYHHEMLLRLTPLFAQMGIRISSRVDHRATWPSKPPRSIPPPPEQPSRLDAYLWQRHRRWTKSTEDCMWLIQAKDEAGARRACEIVDETLREICAVSHRGYLVFPVGFEGLKGKEREIDGVQKDMGVVVEMKGDGCVVIVGPEESIEVARKKILDVVGGSKLKRVDLPVIHISES
ncbi:hypothetical protein M422DRAFT_255975 [Sphaerobolus stellatus SS14]|uniref:K Homology domain-containing protein n=1 Tax=Sphaerobolus stellatus (strain SS14) TaxID=990650 RepID=A0A0C9V279_SPHS4|nr:hypothetical protein M422DRAFT_255975 [Sphaerobolus stellatus SS14]